MHKLEWQAKGMQTQCLHASLCAAMHGVALTKSHGTTFVNNLHIWIAYISENDQWLLHLADWCQLAEKKMCCLNNISN